jgi:aryl-alcohol dehydrogenase-like predicted oxidoreductase
MIARFRGWSAFIGLQIEYSLLERPVEQELVPMPLEFGLGITPWSPLKSGALSRKYTRHNVGQLNGDRGVFLDPFLSRFNREWYLRAHLTFFHRPRRGAALM